MSNQKNAINGAKWTTTATIITVLFAFFQLAIIARVLKSSAFGLVAMSTITINFFHIFANLGFTNSIISKQETNKKILSTIFYSSLSLGFILLILVNLFSHLIADYFNEPRLIHIIRISSINFPLIYAGQIYNILLQKELRFKSLAIIDVSSSLVGTIVTTSLAYNNYEELSLIYGEVFYTAFKLILFVTIGTKLFNPILYFNLKDIKDHLRFGVYNLGEGILSYAGGNSESIIIGKIIGAKALGLYTIAYQLAVYPIVRLNPIIMQVTYPIMAKIKDVASLKRAYIKIIDFITYCNFPLLAGLFITSTSVVPLVYGKGWIDTIPLVKVIVFVSLLKCITAPISSLAFTRGKPNLIFYLNLVILIIKLPILYFFSTSFGLIGVAYANLLTTTIETILTSFLAKYLIGNYFKEFFTNIYKPILLCLIMVVVIAVYQHFIISTNLFHTIIQIAIGGSIYLGLTLKYKLSLSEILELKKSL
ncbi:MAG: MOP flippase family protein [Candidatus Pedobacter colombiensis]|uniref:MOP flippase family protein n=1 Tax=Candidatus Pedobacter colombiensis TaxID=3121371 RepID=A0AAJ6BAF5_9SPHI|nr:MOP flippase family protein [Pedobacter sp.]WEK21213.1 MAG: MOP flippase family protein [Pedobacter sp.]